MTKPTLLSGDNPRIAKGYGVASIRAYIAGVPGWKQGVFRRIDAIVSETAPGVEKAVKWNSPFHGLEKDCWFLSFRCYTHYVKVSFFRGAALDPPPPETSKHPEVRYLHVREDDELCNPFADWVRQVSKLRGEKM